MPLGSSYTVLGPKPRSASQALPDYNLQRYEVPAQGQSALSEQSLPFPEPFPVGEAHLLLQGEPGDAPTFLQRGCGALSSLGPPEAQGPRHWRWGDFSVDSGCYLRSLLPILCCLFSSAPVHTFHRSAQFPVPHCCRESWKTPPGLHRVRQCLKTIITPASKDGPGMVFCGKLINQQQKKKVPL